VHAAGLLERPRGAGPAARGADGAGPVPRPAGGPPPPPCGPPDEVSGLERDELAAYLALAELPGIGPARLRTLVAAFESAAGALHAPHGAIAALPGLSRAAATSIRACSPKSGHDILERLERLGATLLLPDDPAFPPLLREIPEPPVLLYVWGDAAQLKQPAVGVVGSRNHTAYGTEAARLLAKGLA